MSKLLDKFNRSGKKNRAPGSTPNPAREARHSARSKAESLEQDLARSMQELAHLAGQHYSLAQAHQETRLLAAAHFTVLMDYLEKVCEKVGVEIPLPDDFEPIDAEGNEVEVKSRLAVVASSEFRNLAHTHNEDLRKAQEEARSQMLAKLDEYEKEHGEPHPMKEAILNNSQPPPDAQ